MSFNRIIYGILTILIASWFGMVAGCAQAPVATDTAPKMEPAADNQGEVPLTPAENYAAEILSYLIEVTLGKSGNPTLREEWGQRGLSLPLDFKAITDMMQGSEKSPGRVMVLDNNILGLSQVLYHYDKKLNLFKGKSNQTSLFPSSELLSVRALLLQKMDRKEKVNLAELINRKKQLLNKGISAKDINLDGINMNDTEMKLLKDVIHSNPAFMAYLEHPFIVDTLYRIGAISMDPFVNNKIETANYNGTDLKTASHNEPSDKVRVAILPSFVKSFEQQKDQSNNTSYKLVSQQTYQDLTSNIQQKMMQLLQKLVRAHMFPEKQAENTKQNDQQVKQFIDTHLDILLFNQRPLVVHPGNAESVIQNVCPDADFNMIILGENVYLSMHISDVDAFPHVNRIYLDIMDIRHNQADYEISQISMFVFNKLKTFIEPST